MQPGFAVQKPSLSYENGVLKASAAGGLDRDGDGKQSVGAKMEIFVDAQEAVTEIFKDGLPAWAKKLLGLSDEQAEQANVSIQEHVAEKAQA